MRAQLIEFIADRCISDRNDVSANIAFTRSWQSSNVPVTAMLPTFPACTVVICRRCTSLTRLCGMQEDDRDALAAEAGLDRRRSGVAGGGADDGDLFPTLCQHVVEQPAHHLERHVLEGERGAVKQTTEPSHKHGGVGRVLLEDSSTTRKPSSKSSISIHQSTGLQSSVMASNI